MFVHRAAALLHAVFRPHLAMTPLRFANPSPPSGWIEDFHLQAVVHTRHTARGPPAQKNAGGRYHRFSRDHPALPARWSSRLYAGFLALGLLAAMRDNAFHALRGDTSVEVSEPCNFTSARASFVRTSKRTCCEFSRPPLPASRVVTIARNAPPQVRRDARKDRGDLPDDTSEITCDIVTRRAGNAPPSLVISRRRQPISRFRVQGERPSPRNDGGLDIAELMSSAAHAAALASSTPWNA